MSPPRRIVCWSDSDECGHVFCEACLWEALLADRWADQLRCPSCGAVRPSLTREQVRGRPPFTSVSFNAVFPFIIDHNYINSESNLSAYCHADLVCGGRCCQSFCPRVEGTVGHAAG